MSLQDSHQISDVKVMLVKGVDGKGIASIEKTGTQGLVDTYTINFTDGTKTTFTVTNGAGGGMSALLLMTSEAGSEISVTSPSGRSLVVTQVSGSSTVWQCETTEYGVHTISSVLSGETATASVDVDTCKIYNISALHFSASITVSYPEGATCTCTKEGGSPVTALSNPYTFVVGSAGNYTITVLANGETYTSTVSITTNGQTETLTMPVGSTVTPTDDIQILLYCADIWNKDYTTLAELLADSTTLSFVIASNNAVDYLVRSTTWASDMCGDQTAMAYMGLNNYCADTLLLDSIWGPAIHSSPYKDNVINAKVPIMTGNTTPSGECISLGTISRGEKYYPYSNGIGELGIGNSSNPSMDKASGYIFDDPVCVSEVEYTSSGTGYPNTCTMVVQSSLDGVTWDDEYSYSFTGANPGRNVKYSFIPLNKRKARYWRQFTNGYESGSGGIYGFTISKLQFNGRQDV